MLKPLSDKVFIRVSPSDEVSKGGIIIPDTAQKKPHRGEVVYAGPGRRDDRGQLVPLDVKVGDQVIFPDGFGAEVSVEGETLVMISADTILAVVE